MLFPNQTEMTYNAVWHELRECRAILQRCHQPDVIVILAAYRDGRWWVETEDGDYPEPPRFEGDYEAENMIRAGDDAYALGQVAVQLVDDIHTYARRLR